MLLPTIFFAMAYYALAYTMAYAMAYAIGYTVAYAVAHALANAIVIVYHNGKIQGLQLQLLYTLW